MKLRVLQILHGLSRAGAERLVYDMATVNRGSLETAVVCLDQEGPLADELRRQGSTVVCTHRREGIDVRQIPRIADVIRSFRPHVVHCHQYPPFFYGTLACMWAGVGRVLFTEHGRHFPDVVSWKRRLFNRVLIHRTGMITAVCEFSRQRLIVNEGIAPDKVSVVYNGVDVGRFADRVSREESRRNLGLPLDAQIIVQVGNLRKVKDHQTAIRAFDRVHRARPNTFLVLVGDGPEMPACRDLTRYLNLQDAVRFLGQREDIPAILPAGDVMLMTSLSEAHSVSLLEGMACRLPIVATRVGGVPETVVDSETGLLVAPGDAEAIAEAVIRVLSDPNLRVRMGQAGFVRVQSTFRQETMHQQYLKIYRHLADLGENA